MKTKRVRFEATGKHARMGRCTSPSYCLIAEAVNEKLKPEWRAIIHPDEDYEFSSYQINPVSQEMTPYAGSLPCRVNSLARRYDRGYLYAKTSEEEEFNKEKLAKELDEKPFVFHLNIPEEAICG